jgi:hypothetical protein
MKWTKEDVRKACPYLILPAYASTSFVIHQMLFEEWTRKQTVFLVATLVGMVAFRFVLARLAKAAVVLAFVGMAFGNNAEAQSAKKYVMGFGVGNSQQPLGFYTYQGTPYPAQTGAPGYFHTSHEWILTDLNGGKLVGGDKVTLLNKQTKTYLMIQKAGAEGVPEYSYTNFSKTPFEFIIGKNDETKLGPRILPGDFVTLRAIIGRDHIYLTSVRTKDTTKEVCHFNADLNKPSTQCWDEVVPGREVFQTTRFGNSAHAKSHNVSIRVGFFVRQDDLIHGRQLVSKSCYKNGNEFDLCEQMMLVGEFSWADLDRSKTFIDVMSASSSAASAGAATGAIVGLAFGPKGMPVGAAIFGGVGAAVGGAAGLSATWNEQEAAKIKADSDAQRASFEREWTKAYEAERSNPDFVGPVRPEKPVLDIK